MKNELVNLISDVDRELDRRKGNVQHCGRKKIFGKLSRRRGSSCARLSILRRVYRFFWNGERHRTFLSSIACRYIRRGNVAAAKRLHDCLFLQLPPFYRFPSSLLPLFLLFPQFFFTGFCRHFNPRPDSREMERSWQGVSKSCVEGIFFFFFFFLVR